MKTYEVELNGKVYEIQADTTSQLDAAIADLQGKQQPAANPVEGWKPPASQFAPDIPRASTPEELAAHEAKRLATPWDQRVANMAEQNLFSGGATDVRNMLNAIGFSGMATMPQIANSTARLTTGMLDKSMEAAPAVNAAIANYGPKVLSAAETAGLYPWKMLGNSIVTGAKSAFGLGTLGGVSVGVDTVLDKAGLPSVGIVDWWRQFMQKGGQAAGSAAAEIK